MIKEFVIDFFETLFNNYIFLNEKAPAYLQKLQGKIAKFELKGTPFVFFLQFSTQKIFFLRYSEFEPHVIIQGSPLAFLKIWQQKKGSYINATQDFNIIGDMSLAQKINEMMANPDIDWEAQLSRFIGELLAHEIANTSRHISQWFEERKQIFMQNTSEYLQEEKRLLPPSEEIKDFYDDIDEFGHDIDRAEARYRRLQKILTDNQENS